MKRLVLGLGIVAVLLSSATASAQAIAGFAKGYAEPPYSVSGVPLLDSFYLRYSSSDHHVESLGVEPQISSLLVVLADDNQDDEYYYSVEHKGRRDSGIVADSFVDFCNGSCLYPLTPPGPGYVFALRGFRFYFRNGDHHLDQVGIVREASGVRTYFNDQNDDDPYVVYVDYAWLPPSMIQQTAQLTGTARGGVQRSLSSASAAVITSFLVDYADSDHHVREIGVLTRTSDVQVYYGDQNGDDRFSYRVDLAVLAAPRFRLPLDGVLEAPFVVGP